MRKKIKKPKGFIKKSKNYLVKCFYSNLTSFPFSSKRLDWPDFLGIGAQKAGTTWLYENLRKHPEVFIGKKECHYFDKHFDNGHAYYLNHFKKGGSRLKGEITPAYSNLSLEKIRFIKKVMQDVKLIFIMRNPVERAWSQAMMRFVTNKNRNFEEVVDSELYNFFYNNGRGLNRGNYLLILERWLSVFPEEQLHICFFDDLKNHPKEYLSDIFSFLGISTDIDWKSLPYDDVARKGTSIPIPVKYRTFLEDLYRDDIEELYERFGGKVASWRCAPKKDDATEEVSNDRPR